MTPTLPAYEDDDLGRARRRVAVGKVIGIAGVALLLVGGGVLGIGMFKLFRGLSQTRERLTVEVPVPGSGETYLDAGTYDVVAIGTGLTEQVRSGGSNNGTTTRRRRFVEPNITITTSEGRPVTFQNSGSTFTYSNMSYDLVSLRRFRVTDAGTYRIEVNGEPGPVQTIGVGPADSTGGGMLALLGGALLGLGIVVAVVSAVLYGIGRTRRNQLQARFVGGPGWPSPAGYGTTGSSGQQPAGTWTPPPPPPPAPPSPPSGPIS